MIAWDEAGDNACTRILILMSALLLCVGMAIGHYSGIAYAMRMAEVSVSEDAVVIMLDGNEWRHFL